jgi:hypothetical protein
LYGLPYRGFESLSLRQNSDAYGNLVFLRHIAVVTDLCRKA